MLALNNISFILLNWLEIVGFVFMYWKIRKIRNELNIKAELAVIMLFWSIFSIIYFILKFLLIILPEGSDHTASSTKAFIITIFVVI